MNTPKSGILVVIDTSEPGNETVVQRAVSMAQQLNTFVELFSCAYNPYFFGKRSQETDEGRRIKAHHVIDKKHALDELAKEFAQDDVPIKSDVYWDIPEHEAVVRKVFRSCPKLVMRRSEYRTVVDRALLSNDDWALIQHCPAPLYLVRGEPGAPRSGVVWAAVDPMHDHDKPASLDDKIIAEAKMLAVAFGAEVHLYHAFDSAAAIAAMASGIAVIEPLPSEEIHAQIRDAHDKRLQELAEKHNIPSHRVHNIPGAARKVLPALAIEKRPDFIVMGAVSRGFFKRALLGSTAKKILDKLPGDLCVVKPDDFKSNIEPESPYELRFRETAELDKGAA